MIDHFSILLSHGLLLFAFWRLLHRPDLDDEMAVPYAQPADRVSASASAATATAADPPPTRQGWR